jgi:hypothetical protein
MISSLQSVAQERSVGRLRDGLGDHLPASGPPVHRHPQRAVRRSQAWRPRPLARQTRAVPAILASALLAFLHPPIAFLILFSFEEADTPGFPITGLTAHAARVEMGEVAVTASEPRRTPGQSRW